MRTDLAKVSRVVGCMAKSLSAKGLIAMLDPTILKKVNNV